MHATHTFDTVHPAVKSRCALYAANDGDVSPAQDVVNISRSPLFEAHHSLHIDTDNTRREEGRKTE